MDEINNLPIREIDTSSIQQQMARNKELLQVKLMVRRPISQLIDQGILPPLRQSPVLFEQAKKLERARTENFLKHKISNRPNRQQLIEHHILEDTNISPRLIAKQQQLKKAKLADDLNERLSHRPGPLELIKGNILLPSNLQIEQAVKQGTIEFKPTSAGETIKYPTPSFLILKKDANQKNSNNYSANCCPQVQKNVNCCNDYHYNQFCNSLANKTNSIEANLDFVETFEESKLTDKTNNKVVNTSNGELDVENEDSNQTNSSLFSSNSSNENEESSSINQHNDDKFYYNSKTPVTLNSNNSNEISQSNQFNVNSQIKQEFSPQNSFSIKNLSASFCKNSSTFLKNSNNKTKKSKLKIPSKNKIIKFHEYKGPPNAVKQQFTNDCPKAETAYELLLQQQQLYLQLELEMQQKQLSTQQRSNLSNQNKEQDKNNKNSNNSNLVTKINFNSNDNLITSSSKINKETLVPSNFMNSVENNFNEQEMSDDIFTSKNISDKIDFEEKLADINKIEEMKVNDLKQELKRFNLPVSGSKNTLIERLKNFVQAKKNTKSLNNFVENMDIDVQQSFNLKPNNMSSNNSSNKNQSFYSNTVLSTPVKTFASLSSTSTDQALNATAYLSQSPAFLPTKPSSLSSSNFNSSSQIDQNSSNKLNNLKQNIVNKQRRTSEPQLQHIQLHFANPFFQIGNSNQATFQNSSIMPTAITNPNSTHQIHFLSTPTLNTNDLHLFTQPTQLLSSDNHILPSNTKILNSSCSTNSSQTTWNSNWSFQPSNSFPQLFFYPTQITTNQSNQLANLTNNSNSLISSSVSLNNLSNSQFSKESSQKPFFSKFESINHLTKFQQNNSKSNINKNKISNSKTSNKLPKNNFSLRGTKSNSFSNGIDICKNFKNCGSIDNLNKTSNDSFNSNKFTNNLTNKMLNVSNQKNMFNVVQSKKNNFDSSNQNINQYANQINSNLDLDNKKPYLHLNILETSTTTASNFFSNTISNANFIDKPPPNYEEATKNANKTNLILLNDLPPSAKKNNFETNLTFSPVKTTSINNENSKSELAISNVKNVTTNCINTTNYLNCNTSNANKTEENLLADILDSNINATTNLFKNESLNVGNHSANTAGKKIGFQKSSSLSSLVNTNLNKNNIHNDLFFTCTVSKDSSVDCIKTNYLMKKNGSINYLKNTEFLAKQDIYNNLKNSSNLNDSNNLNVSNILNCSNSLNCPNQLNCSNELSFSNELNFSNQLNNENIKKDSQIFDEIINKKNYNEMSMDVEKELVDPNKTESDFNLDFDLLMEVPDFANFVDFDNSEQKKENKNINNFEKQLNNFAELDSNYTINQTIDENYDKNNINNLEQRLDTPTFLNQRDFSFEKMTTNSQVFDDSIKSEDEIFENNSINNLISSSTCSEITPKWLNQEYSHVL